jgi:hypothetical protein
MGAKEELENRKKVIEKPKEKETKGQTEPDLKKADNEEVEPGKGDGNLQEFSKEQHHNHAKNTYAIGKVTALHQKMLNEIYGTLKAHEQILTEHAKHHNATYQVISAMAGKNKTGV